MATSHAWAFRSSFRRHAFGWKGTRKAIERLNEAVAEIERMARSDPALAGEGAVLLLEKLSPAISDIDSSSGARGNAAAGVVATLAPLIAAAPVPRPVRERWLERLFDAVQEPANRLGSRSPSRLDRGVTCPSEAPQCAPARPTGPGRPGRRHRR